MATQGQTITSTQPQHRRTIEIFVVAFAGAALAITLAWAAFGATTPKVVTPSRTTEQILLEPGLVDQRADERGVVVAPAPATGYPGGWTSNYSPIQSRTTEQILLEPGLVDQRADERGVAVAPAPATGYPGGWTSNYSPIDVAPGAIDFNDHALQQMRRGERDR
jgi:hypothetical protein